MPGRKLPIVTGGFYHIVNRGVASRPVFFSKRCYQRMLMLIPYYRYASPPFKLSRFLAFSKTRQAKILQEMYRSGQPLVDTSAYCLMPNHFHILVKQNLNEGIAKFISNITNAYTRYLNTKHERKGHIFQGKFKAVRVENEEQLLHLSRYIHLNPFSSYIVKNATDVTTYPYSSLPEYLQKTNDGFCQKQAVLASFKDPTTYREFVLDQTDYQQRLQDIKHLILDDL
jgi:putative transposase